LVDPFLREFVESVLLLFVRILREPMPLPLTSPEMRLSWDCVPADNAEALPLPDALVAELPEAPMEL
jgi:hypothetical protein